MYDEYRAKPVAVHDGDTFTLLIDCGFYTWTEQRIRLKNVDCPELNTPEGKLAREFTHSWFAKREYVLVKPSKARSGVFVQSFARFVAVVYDASEMLGMEIVRNGHGRWREDAEVGA